LTSLSFTVIKKSPDINLLLYKLFFLYPMRFLVFSYCIKQIKEGAWSKEDYKY